MRRRVTSSPPSSATEPKRRTDSDLSLRVRSDVELRIGDTPEVVPWIRSRRSKRRTHSTLRSTRDGDCQQNYVTHYVYFAGLVWTSTPRVAPKDDQLQLVPTLPRPHPAFTRSGRVELLVLDCLTEFKRVPVLDSVTERLTYPCQRVRSPWSQFRSPLRDRGNGVRSRSLVTLVDPV